MRSKNKIFIAPRLLALFLLINLCIACAWGTSLSPGAWVAEEDRISIMDGGPHKGSWKTRDLTIHYEYQGAAPNLQVTGVVELANYIPMGFSVLEHLHLNIHFLEASGTVLEVKRIRSFGSRLSISMLRDLNFNSRFDLPQDTVAFAFSYSGKASTGGVPGGASSSRGRTDWDFWKVPRRSPPK